MAAFGFFIYASTFSRTYLMNLGFSRTCVQMSLRSLYSFTLLASTFATINAGPLIL